MTTTQEALKMDLENLIDRFNEGWHEGIEIDASDIMLLSNLREALEQQEQEPVVIGWRTDDYLLETTDKEVALTWQAHFKVIPIFATHPAKQLSDDEIEEVLNNSPYCEVDAKPFARAIEAKIRGK